MDRCRSDAAQIADRPSSTVTFPSTLSSGLRCGGASIWLGLGLVHEKGLVEVDDPGDIEVETEEFLFKALTGRYLSRLLEAE